MNDEVAVDQEAADRDHQLRVIGFLLAGVGALLAGVGALLDWLSFGATNYREIAVTPTSKGIDLWQGKVILALAVTSLIAVLASRLAERLTARRAAAIIVIVAGLAVVGIGGAYVVSGGSSAARDAVDDILQGNQVTDETRNQVLAALDVEVKIGAWISLAGGVMVAAGGVLALAWVTRTAVPPEAPPAH
jgi:hypothetical protein